MRVAPGFFGSLFCGSRGCELAFDAQALWQEKAGQTVSQVLLEAVTSATAEPGMLWSTIIVSTSTQRITLNGVPKNRAGHFVESLRSAIRQALITAVSQHEPELKRIAAGPDCGAPDDGTPLFGALET